MIKRKGKWFYLYSRDGKKKLGRHPSRAKAEAQESAIMIRKAMSKKGKNK